MRPCCRSRSSGWARRPTSCPGSPSRSTPTTRVPARRPGSGSVGAPAGSVWTGRWRPTICGRCWPGCDPESGGLSPNGTPIRPTRQAGARVRRHVQGPEVGQRPLRRVGRPDDPRGGDRRRRTRGARGDRLAGARGRSRCGAASHNTAQVEARRAKLVAAGEGPGRRRRPTSAEDVGGRRGGVPASHQPGRGPVAALARPDRQHGRGQPTGGGPPSCTPTCTGTPRPPVRCSRRRSGPS